jgi:hypothetical protein
MILKHITVYRRAHLGDGQYAPKGERHVPDGTVIGVIVPK